MLCCSTPVEPLCPLLHLHIFRIFCCRKAGCVGGKEGNSRQFSCRTFHNTRKFTVITNARTCPYRRWCSVRQWNVRINLLSVPLEFSYWSALITFIFFWDSGNSSTFRVLPRKYTLIRSLSELVHTSWSENWLPSLTLVRRPCTKSGCIKMYTVCSFHPYTPW